MVQTLKNVTCKEIAPTNWNGEARTSPSNLVCDENAQMRGENVTTNNIKHITPASTRTNHKCHANTEIKTPTCNLRNQITLTNQATWTCGTCACHLHTARDRKHLTQHGPQETNVRINKRAKCRHTGPRQATGCGWCIGLASIGAMVGFGAWRRVST